MAGNILLLEDSEAISKNIYLTLKEYGYEVLSTDSTSEGLYILSEYRIGLVIVDMNIDNGEIVYFINALKSDYKYNSIPLLMLADDSGKNSWRHIHGIENWIIKPFSAIKLLNIVERLSI